MSVQTRTFALYGGPMDGQCIDLSVDTTTYIVGRRGDTLFLEDPYPPDGDARLPMELGRYERDESVAPAILGVSPVRLAWRGWARMSDEMLRPD